MRFRSGWVGGVGGTSGGVLVPVLVVTQADLCVIIGACADSCITDRADRGVRSEDEFTGCYYYHPTIINVTYK